MDNSRFEQVTRRLSNDSTRRNFCKVAGAGALGVAMARLGLGGAVAACKKVTIKCDENSECCGALVCRRANSQNYYPKTVKRCCRPIGDNCNQGIDCCGVDVICNGGICQKA